MIKPYNHLTESDVLALKAFFSSPLVRPYLFKHFGVLNPRQNPAKYGVDVLADTLWGQVRGIELERKECAGTWHEGRFPFDDIQVPDRKTDHFENGHIFVMFDETFSWAFVWNCRILPGYSKDPSLGQRWTYRYIPSEGNMLVVPLWAAALIKVDPKVPGPLVAFNAGDRKPRIRPDQKEVDLSAL